MGVHGTPAGRGFHYKKLRVGDDFVQNSTKNNLIEIEIGDII